MQRQRLLSDRQQFQREQMKLLELRSPTTLTPQTPLPLTPSATGIKRQFVVPTSKPAPPPPTKDTAKDTTSSAVAEEGVAKDSITSEGVATDATGDGSSSLQNITSRLQDGSVAANIDILTAAGPGGGAELLPPVDEEITNSATNAAPEDLFPIDFPNSDHQSPVNDHMMPEGHDDVQQSLTEFESSNQMPSDMAASPDPTAFDDFDHVGQFGQSDALPEANQSDQLEKLAEQLDHLPQQPMDDDRQMDVHQLEELSTDTS